MQKLYLGEFEELVLTMVAILGENAYGNSIVHAIDDQLNRKVNLSAVHITLYRLEDKGLVKSYMGGVTRNRGGRRKRLFEMTSGGVKVLRDVQDQKQRLWKLLPEFKFSGAI